jgi:hypothetical protein
LESPLLLLRFSLSLFLFILPLLKPYITAGKFSTETVFGLSNTEAYIGLKCFLTDLWIFASNTMAWLMHTNLRRFSASSIP